MRPLEELAGNHGPVVGESLLAWMLCASTVKMASLAIERLERQFFWRVLSIVPVLLPSWETSASSGRRPSVERVAA